MLTHRHDLVDLFVTHLAQYSLHPRQSMPLSAVCHGTFSLEGLEKPGIEPWFTKQLLNHLTSEAFSYKCRKEHGYNISCPFPKMSPGSMFFKYLFLFILVITRSCGVTKMAEGCSSISALGVTTETCYCNTDECTTASPGNIPCTLSLLTVGFGVVMKLVF